MTPQAIFSLPQLPLDRWVEDATQWLLDHASGLFSVISSVIGSINDALVSALHGMPEWLVLSMFVLLAWEFVGPVGGVLTFVALGLIDNLGMWSPMLDTLALTLTSAILALVIAEPIGIWAGLHRRREDLLRPVLDFMQTMPPYVYLIPAVMFFSLGAVPAVVSTVIFATAPPIRLTALGLRQVPRQMVEVGSAFGATRGQLLRKVQLPLALPSILAGVNQCIMLSLSMVIIASLIGAKGLGENIIFAITQVQVGAGFVGGLSVVLLAIIIDRITSGMGHRPLQRRPTVHVWTAPLTALLRAIRRRFGGRETHPTTPTIALQSASMPYVDQQGAERRKKETV
jgi:ABC-type proline/glycine betaine transport system permease subunit